MFTRPHDLIRPSLTIAMVPIAPAVGVTFGLMLTSWPSMPHPEGLALGVTTVLTMVVGLVVWVRLIHWTLRRVMGTAAAKATVIVHLALWHPLWDAGCLNDVLITFQGLTLLGLFWWLVPLIWWGSLKRPGVGARADPQDSSRRFLMLRLPVGYLRAVALVPLASGLYVMCYLLLDDLNPASWSDRIPWVLSNALIAGLVAGGWILAWRRGVWWTSRRKSGTAWMAILLVLFCGVCGLIEASADWIASMCLTLPLTLTGLFMVATARLWQGSQPVSAPADPVRMRAQCPACGASMAGSHEARCPECGESYTVEVLFAFSLSEGLHPHCPACGYDMAGLDRARCPECGGSFTLEGLFASNVGLG